MRNKIWYELVHVKYGEQYLNFYIGCQQTLKKTFQILTLVVSGSGILGWKYFEEYTWIALLLIMIMQLFLLVENQLIRSDKEIEEIIQLKMRYTKYFNKIEKLWTDFTRKVIDEEEAQERFFSLRRSDWEPIEELDAKLNIKKYQRLILKSDEETNQYIKTYHNYE